MLIGLGKQKLFNNIPENFLKIKQGLHRSLHCRGYEYLVILGREKEYIKVFISNHQKEFSQSKMKVEHHIDCDRSNNKKDNFMYLPSMSVHFKLHQEAYQFLVDIGKVRNYIDWFLSKER